MTFGERLKILRNEKNITQTELGSKFNLGKTAISLYETNDRFPDKNILIMLADYFDVSIDYLLGKTNIKYTPEMLEAYQKGMEIRERQEQERIDTSKLRFGLSADDLEHLTEEQKNAIKILAEGFIKENYKKGK